MSQGVAALKLINILGGISNAINRRRPIHLPAYVSKHTSVFAEHSWSAQFGAFECSFQYRVYIRLTIISELTFHRVAFHGELIVYLFSIIDVQSISRDS